MLSHFSLPYTHTHTHIFIHKLYEIEKAEYSNCIHIFYNRLWLITIIRIGIRILIPGTKWFSTYFELSRIYITTFIHLFSIFVSFFRQAIWLLPTPSISFFVHSVFAFLFNVIWDKRANQIQKSERLWIDMFAVFFFFFLLLLLPIYFHCSCAIGVIERK